MNATEADDDSSTDFGRTVVRRPAVVVDARGVDAGAAALAAARDRDLTLVVRGAGHACGGQALGDGVVLRSYAPGAVEATLGDGIVVVPARTSWRDLELWLNQRGKMVPVTTDYLALSVGGTLSVGGFGFDSLTRGSQIDHVVWARVRLANGEVRQLDRGVELLRFVLTGLGRLAVIEEVALDVIPFAPLLRVHARRHPDLLALAQAMAWLDDPAVTRPTTQLAVQYWPNGETIERIGDDHATAATIATTPAPAWARPEHFERVVPMRRFVEHVAVRRWVESFPGHRRLWADYGFTHRALIEFVRHVDGLRTSALGSVIRAIYLAAVRAPVAGRALGAFDLRLPGERYTFTCGLYAMLPAGDDALLEQALGRWHEITALAIELGGRPYLYGRYRLDDQQRRACYGRDHARYLELKRELDPTDRLASGRGTI